VRITDRNVGGRSVTNDAELVIRDLVEFGIDLDRRQVIYRDSDGQWSGIATRGGLFVGFTPLAGGTAA
jgi:hypothetical protein